ncbi:glycoprotein [Lake Victoria marburgvirus - Leiden]|uniref:Envelope glycoprotein n=1 Tax=Lake Victoria marburgvirus - Leiden TaxID=1126254 RepID=G9HWE5_9MONO|nr:glycoprotein [Lake Victoria marburgvirus - Leiden]
MKTTCLFISLILIQGIKTLPILEIASNNQPQNVDSVCSGTLQKTEDVHLMGFTLSGQKVADSPLEASKRWAFRTGVPPKNVEYTEGEEAKTCYNISVTDPSGKSLLLDPPTNIRDYPKCKTIHHIQGQNPHAQGIALHLWGAFFLYDRIASTTMYRGRVFTEGNIAAMIVNKTVHKMIFSRQGQGYRHMNLTSTNKYWTSNNGTQTNDTGCFGALQEYNSTKNQTCAPSKIPSPLPTTRPENKPTSTPTDATALNTTDPNSDDEDLTTSGSGSGEQEPHTTSDAVTTQGPSSTMPPTPSPQPSTPQQEGNNTDHSQSAVTEPNKTNTTAQPSMPPHNTTAISTNNTSKSNFSTLSAPLQNTINYDTQSTATENEQTSAPSKTTLPPTGNLTTAKSTNNTKGPTTTAPNMTNGHLTSPSPTPNPTTQHLVYFRKKRSILWREGDMFPFLDGLINAPIDFDPVPNTKTIFDESSSSGASTEEDQHASPNISLTLSYFPNINENTAYSGENENDCDAELRIWSVQEDDLAAGLSWIPFFGPGIEGLYTAGLIKNQNNLVCRLRRLANQTAKSLELLLRVTTEERTFSLINRHAIDFLLTRWGGTCKVLGPDCCIGIEDLSRNISEQIDQIKKDEQKEGTGWGLGGKWWTSDWGVLTNLGILLLLSIAVLIALSCICRIFTKYIG